MSTHKTIVNGPSKFNLMLALFDARHHQKVTFMIDGSMSPDIEVGINAVSQEDGSGESWCFEGYIPYTKTTQRVKGHFRTDTRRGWLEILDD